jgi:multidrug resistance efflux pump
LAESQEQQQAQIDLANERVASALLAVEHARNGRPLELEAQRSRIAVAAAKHKQAQADVEYFEKLRKLAEPLATEQQVEHQRLMLEAAAAEFEAAQVASKRLEQTLTFQQQTADAELHAARQSLAIAERGRGVESFKRRVALADLKRRQTRLTAPSAGVVLSVGVRPGELVAQLPLVELANLDHLICTAEVEAGDVPYLKNAQHATIECRAFRGSRLKGRIDRVANQVALATLRPLDPRKPVERDVANVIVTIDAQEAARLINTTHADHRAALVGLQVEVSFPMDAQPDKSAF